MARFQFPAGEASIPKHLHSDVLSIEFLNHPNIDWIILLHENGLPGRVQREIHLLPVR